MKTFNEFIISENENNIELFEHIVSDIYNYIKDKTLNKDVSTMQYIGQTSKNPYVQNFAKKQKTASNLERIPQICSIKNRRASNKKADDKKKLIISNMNFFQKNINKQLKNYSNHKMENSLQIDNVKNRYYLKIKNPQKSIHNNYSLPKIKIMKNPMQISLDKEEKKFKEKANSERNILNYGNNKKSKIIYKLKESKFLQNKYSEEISLSEILNENYSNNGYSLGYYLQPNSDEFMLSFDCKPNADSTAAFQYQLIRHGADYGDKSVPGSNLYSELPRRGRGDLRKNFLFDGAYEWSHIWTLSGSYKINTKLPIKVWANAGVIYDYFTSIEGESVSIYEYLDRFSVNEDNFHVNEGDYKDTLGCVVTLGITLFGR